MKMMQNMGFKDRGAFSKDINGKISDFNGTKITSPLAQSFKPISKRDTFGLGFQPTIEELEMQQTKEDSL